MSYFYEELGDERFQKFAQALIASSYPHAQCLPVGMPDGGRDAFILPRLGKNKHYIVFQVKFSKNPSSKEARDVIDNLIRTDAKAIKKLISRGTAEYILVTNVQGTSHADTGSIDKVNALLADAIGIAASCWWRDDLDARLASANAVQWAFPEILKGTDVLAHLTNLIFKENAQTRNAALKSYLAAQYESDAEVRFKQVELQNQLLDLFVDLPASSTGSFSYRERRSSIDFTWQLDERNSQQTGISELFLTDTTNRTNRTVLEGAPGQGKSTVTQYICQVHRVRLLQKHFDFSKISKTHLTSPLKVPFRIDLRDYATWLSGKNPFSPEGAAIPLSAGLESFVAFQVHVLSGGLEFSASDLIAILKNGPALFALDGFDEVADVAVRQQIIAELNKASARIRAHQTDVQIIVTSRPAAFANSPGFARSNWLHLELQDLHIEHINAYASKWMDARHLQRRERTQFVALLREKLEQSHTRDLARNPMQLTILLALINSRGLSLPDKRTALYDSYMEHFFNRESEKSRVVLEHRDLLIDIHRYVAWTLHSRAEEDGGNGAISETDLKKLLQDYLVAEGHDTALINALFTGMIERVVALVSRVQGTYEFEVQPLREYFVARHLYETAPYSPAGSERQGTKTDRFKALAKNFYWLNVARFYCGCYSKGELASLVVGLREVESEREYRPISHPRLLAAMLLSDWVFAQQPLTSDDVFSFLTQRPQFDVLLASASKTSTNPLTMADPRAKAEMAGRCRDILVSTALPELRSYLARIVIANEKRDDTYKWWSKSQNLFDHDTDWLDIGLRLNVFKEISLDEITLLFGLNIESIVPLLLAARRYDIADEDRELKQKFLDRILSGRPGAVVIYPVEQKRWELDVFSVAVSNFILSQIFEAPSQVSARHIATRYHAYVPDDIFGDDIVDKNRDLSDFFSIYYSQLDLSCGEWQSSIEPWRQLANALFSQFGENAIMIALSVAGGGIKNRGSVGKWSLQGWKPSKDLTERARFARLKSGQAKWWQDQAPEPGSGAQEIVFLSCLICWATESTLRQLAVLIEERVNSLDLEGWDQLCYVIDFCIFITSSKLKNVKTKTISNEARFLYLLAKRGDEATSRHSAAQLLDYEGADAKIYGFIMENSFIEAKAGRMPWVDALRILRKGHSKGGKMRGPGPEEASMPLADAVSVCSSADEYPLGIVFQAQRVASASVGSLVPSLSAVASTEGWFS